VSEEKRRLLSYLRRDRNDRGQRRDGLNEDYFFDPELRGNLEHVFVGKCGFCETKVEDAGQTLHLRPLRFAAGSPRVDKDYYLWLAFEWRNLFYACQYCVRSKGDRFPVDGDRAPYLATFDDVVEQEIGLLIDPTADDPGRHLRFLTDGDILPLSLQGRETIDIFDLNRGDLTSARGKLVRQLFEIFRADDRNYASGELRQLLNPFAPHSGALQSVLKRVATAWRASDSPIPGSGDAFVRKFVEIWNQSSSAQRSRLPAVIHEVEEGDRRAKDQIGHTVPFPSRNSFDLTKRDPLSVIDREIAHIEISSFKAIEDLRFELRSSRTAKSGAPSLMILGENSTGKSSALSAIALALVGRRRLPSLRNTCLVSCVVQDSIVLTNWTTRG
jgi:hypothetical protein